MSSPESPMTFYESLPPYTRDWLWLPRCTVTLTLALPTGGGTVFHTRYCPQALCVAYNVASLQEPPP